MYNKKNKVLACFQTRPCSCLKDSGTSTKLGLYLFSRIKIKILC